jgi:hypothetical protein
MSRGIGNGGLDRQSFGYVLWILVGSSYAGGTDKDIKSSLQSRCESVNDIWLCPINVGEGNSEIKSIGQNTADGKEAAWNRSGWCGLSHDVLRIDFGKKFDIRQVRIKGVTTRTRPEYIKLDYFDYDRGQAGDYERYLNSTGSDNIVASEAGTLLAAANGQAIETDRIKVTMVLPEQTPSTQRACMRIEIYYFEKSGPSGSTSGPAEYSGSSFLSKPGIKMNFGIFGASNDEGSYAWTQFPFVFKGTQSIRSVAVTWKVTPITQREITLPNENIDVNMYLRVQASQSTEKSGNHRLNEYVHTELQLDQV